MFEVIVKIYSFSSCGERIIHYDIFGYFNTEKEGNKFLWEQLKKVCKMNREDIQIDVKFFQRFS